MKVNWESAFNPLTESERSCSTAGFMATALDPLAPSMFPLLGSTVPWSAASSESRLGLTQPPDPAPPTPNASFMATALDFALPAGTMLPFGAAHSDTQPTFPWSPDPKSFTSKLPTPIDYSSSTALPTTIDYSSSTASFMATALDSSYKGPITPNPNPTLFPSWGVATVNAQSVDSHSFFSGKKFTEPQNPKPTFPWSRSFAPVPEPDMTFMFTLFDPDRPKPYSWTVDKTKPAVPASSFPITPAPDNSFMSTALDTWKPKPAPFDMTATLMCTALDRSVPPPSFGESSSQIWARKTGQSEISPSPPFTLMSQRLDPTATRMSTALAPDPAPSNELILIPKVGTQRLPLYFCGKPPHINCDICQKKDVLYGYHVQFYPKQLVDQADPQMDLCLDCGFLALKNAALPQEFAKKYVSFLPITRPQLIQFEPMP